MNSITKEIHIDVTNKSIITLYMNQYEKNTRFIKVHCTSKGEMYPIDPNNIIITRYSKPDGNSIICNSDIQNDGTIMFEITEQMTSSEGLATCSFQIMSVPDNRVLCTTNFNIRINKSAVSDAAIKSSSEFKSLSDLIIRAEDALKNEEELEEALDQAKNYMESADESADNANVSEGKAKISENNAKASENTATASAAASAAKAGEAKTSADKAKVSETNAKTSETNSGSFLDKSTASAKLSESFAKGGTGTRTGEDSDNAKYYCKRAEEISNVNNYVLASSIGTSGGIASLDVNGKIPKSQIPENIVAKVDGMDAALAGKLSLTGGTLTGKLVTQPVIQKMNAIGGISNPLQIMGTQDKGAYLTFHKPNVYAVNLGIGADTNDVCIGGYTMGAAQYPIIHTGNIESYIQPETLGVKEITKNLTVTKDWQNTGISGADLKSGSYIVSVSPMSTDATDIWDTSFIGILYWYDGNIATYLDTEEVLLHKSGYTTNGNFIYLRTGNNDVRYTKLQLQIACKVGKRIPETGTATSFGPCNYIFKFKKLMI